VAAWFLDGDYDGRTFCITQAFFPDRSAWDKLARALGGKNGIIAEEVFDKLSLREHPFPVHPVSDHAEDYRRSVIPLHEQHGPEEPSDAVAVEAPVVPPGVLLRAGVRRQKSELQRCRST
jgi:hypothetical protein